MTDEKPDAPEEPEPDICKMCGANKATVKADSGNLIFCAACFDEWKIDQNKIIELTKQGHPYHCACRQVWGDGECECDLYAKGYDPYAWTRKKEPEPDMVDMVTELFDPGVQANGSH